MLTELQSYVKFQFEEFPFLRGNENPSNQAVLDLPVIRGCRLTWAIREEQSSYQENLVAAAQCGKVKCSGSGDWNLIQNEHSDEGGV